MAEEKRRTEIKAREAAYVPALEEEFEEDRMAELPSRAAQSKGTTRSYSGALGQY